MKKAAFRYRTCRYNDKSPIGNVKLPIGNFTRHNLIQPYKLINEVLTQCNETWL